MVNYCIIWFIVSNSIASILKYCTATEIFTYDFYFMIRKNIFINRKIDL